MKPNNVYLEKEYTSDSRGASSCFKKDVQIVGDEKELFQISQKFQLRTIWTTNVLILLGFGYLEFNGKNSIKFSNLKTLSKSVLYKF